MGTSSITEFRGFLQSFALLPLSQLLVQRNRLAGKNSRSPVAELSQQRIGDVVNGERMLGRVLGDARVEEHLQQHVAELVAQRVGIAAVDRVEKLVGLLQQKPAQRVVRLLAFPRPGGAQLVHHRDGVHQPLPGLLTGRGDQPLAGGQPRGDRGVLGVGGQQHRSVLAGVRRARRRQRPGHRDRHLLGVLHLTG